MTREEKYKMIYEKREIGVKRAERNYYLTRSKRDKEYWEYLKQRQARYKL